MNLKYNLIGYRLNFTEEKRIGKNAKTERFGEEFEEFISMYFELGVEEILKGNIPADVFDLTHDKIQIIIRNGIYLQ